MLTEVKGTLDKINYDAVIGQVLPQPVKDVIVTMGKALNILLKSQENLTSALIDVVKVKETSSGTGEVRTGVESRQRVKPPPPAPIDPKVSAERKVKQALREAEKKTTLFNIDMGKVPTLNKDTLSRKVTIALGQKASAGNHDYDIKDAEEAIDDILSCVKLDFMGTTSKKFYNKKNPQDPRNETFCTIPVKFEFKDRLTRMQAEKTLRKVCGVSCAVPYPKKLRSMLDMLISEGKKKYPDNFIRTRVNVEELTVEAHAKSGNNWIDLGLKCNIPTNICDLGIDVSVSQVNGSQNPASQVASTQDEVMSVS
jgi:hypothetical protein